MTVPRSASIEGNREMWVETFAEVVVIVVLGSVAFA